MCLAIVDGKVTLTYHYLLGKSPHLRALTPVLSMVAVDLMVEFEHFMKNLDPWMQHPGSIHEARQDAWFKALEVIVDFRLPICRPGVQRGIPKGNGRCWTVPCAFFITRLC